MAQTPTLFLRVFIAGYEDLLCKTLKIVLIQVIPEWFQLIPRPADKWTASGRPSVEVDGDKMTQLFAGPLSCFIRTFQAKKQSVFELTR